MWVCPMPEIRYFYIRKWLWYSELATIPSTKLGREASDVEIIEMVYVASGLGQQCNDMLMNDQDQ